MDVKFVLAVVYLVVAFVVWRQLYNPSFLRGMRSWCRRFPHRLQHLAVSMLHIYR